MNKCFAVGIIGTKGKEGWWWADGQGEAEEAYLWELHCVAFVPMLSAGSDCGSGMHTHAGATWRRPEGPAWTERLYVNIYVPDTPSNLLTA